MCKTKETAQKLQLAVVSYDASWLRVVANYFSEQKCFGTIDYYTRGEKLLADLAADCMPHFIVLDENMQDIDLSSFMQRYQALKLKKKPIVLGLCSRRYLGYTGNLFMLGMTDFLTKPIQLHRLTERLIQLYQAQNYGRVNLFCQALYRAWLIDENEATGYLTDAVKIASDSISKLAVRKEIIWPIAEQHGCSNGAVDSALRRLIDKMERVAAPDYLVFKEKVGWGQTRPSVGQLVYALKQELEAENNVFQ